MSNVHISVAAIAAANRHFAPGRAQSPPKGHLRRARATRHNLYVPLANVEARLGQRISPEQVASTTAGNPARVVTITSED